MNLERTPDRERAVHIAHVGSALASLVGTVEKNVFRPFSTRNLDTAVIRPPEPKTIEHILRSTQRQRHAISQVGLEPYSERFENAYGLIETALEHLSTIAPEDLVLAIPVAERSSEPPKDSREVYEAFARAFLEDRHEAREPKPFIELNTASAEFLYRVARNAGESPIMYPIMNTDTVSRILSPTELFGNLLLNEATALLNANERFRGDLGPDAGTLTKYPEAIDALLGLTDPKNNPYLSRF